MMKNNRLTILGANSMYLIVAILLITAGGFFQDLDVKSGLLITEYIIVLLPVIIYIKMKGLSFKKVLKLKPLRLKHMLLIILITILAYPIALFFNLVMMIILSMLNGIKSVPIPVASDFREYIGLFFIIAVSAGICEEVFFRGMLLNAYEKRYGKGAIVITAIMFGVFHFNLQNLFGPIVLGLIFGYLVHLTDSIYAGIIGHITNNGFAVTIAYIINVTSQKINEYVNTQPQEVMPGTLQLIAATIMIGIIAAITGFFSYLLIKVIKKDLSKENNKLEKNHLEISNEEIMEEEFYMGEDINIKQEKIIHYIPVLLVVIIFIIIAFIQLSIPS